jgi:hypothetical protein
MKVAKARYVGNRAPQTYKGPSNSTYTFNSYGPGVPEEHAIVEIDDIDDARHFADHPAVEVEWTPWGTIKREAEGPVESVKDLGYTLKQKLVGDDGFDLEVAGNAAEEEMNEALEEHIKELQAKGGER